MRQKWIDEGKIRLVNWWNRIKFMNYGELLVLILWVESCKAVPAGRTSAPFLVLDWFPSVSPTTIVHVWSIELTGTTVIASPYFGWRKRLLNKKFRIWIKDDLYTDHIFLGVFTWRCTIVHCHISFWIWWNVLLKFFGFFDCHEIWVRFHHVLRVVPPGLTVLKYFLQYRCRIE